MLTSQLKMLMIYLSRLYTQQFGDSTATGARHILLNFIDLINQHHTTHHEVAGYASMLNITPGYLGDIIKDISGKTALSHIHERIAVEAKRMLLHTELTVKEITDELGFQDAAYFNRFFKRMAGTTPAAYRENIRKMYS
jgi:AraC-like DNA-binding protein